MIQQGDLRRNVLGLVAVFLCTHVKSALSLPPTLVRLSENRPYWRVRGQKIELPVELKVLIRSLSQERSFHVSGESLRVGNVFLEAPLSCSFFNLQQAFFMPAALSDQMPNTNPFKKGDWRCRSGDLNFSLHSPLVIAAQSANGFMEIGHERFRNKIELVPRGGELYLVNDVPLEPYLAGLVNKEMRSSFPKEAVKAQVIAARSYALATMAERREGGLNWYDLKGTEADQVYAGAHTEDRVSLRLVEETKGYVLMHQNDILKAYYHASSGGYTELPQNVWGKNKSSDFEYAYLARHSPWDSEGSAATNWSLRVNPALGAMWPGVGKILDLQVMQRSAGQRVEKIKVRGLLGTVVWSGQEFRRRLGVKWLKSSLFSVQRLPEGFLISGRGYGHGVGMSQLGAKAMAKTGKSAREILEFYYPYAGLRKMSLGHSSQSVELGAR